MFNKRKGYNPKRRILKAGTLPDSTLASLVKRASYGGNPEHKKNPEDYGLTPPASHRPGKMLCDGERRIRKAEAERLLKDGIQHGSVSEQCVGEYPQNIWSLHDKVVFEAQLENAEQGVYHGYPLPSDDDFVMKVKKFWEAT